MTVCVCVSMEKKRVRVCMRVIVLCHSAVCVRVTGGVCMAVYVCVSMEKKRASVYLCVIVWRICVLFMLCPLDAAVDCVMEVCAPVQRLKR